MTNNYDEYVSVDGVRIHKELFPEVYDKCGQTGGICNKLKGCNMFVEKDETMMIDNTSFCIPCYEKYEDDEDEEDNEEDEGVCDECNITFIKTDRLTMCGDCWDTLGS